MENMATESNASIIGTDYYMYEKIGKMASDIEHLQKDTIQLKASVNTLDEKIGKVESDIEHLQKDTIQLKASVNTLDEKIGKVESDIEHLQKDTIQLRASVNTLDEKIEKLNDKIEKKHNTLLVIIGIGFTSLATLITIFNFI